MPFRKIETVPFMNLKRKSVTPVTKSIVVLFLTVPSLQKTKRGRVLGCGALREAVHPERERL